MKKINPFHYFVLLFFGLATTACSEHADYNITEHTVDFRVSGGIAELYDCTLRKRYFLSKIGAYERLVKQYIGLKLERENDVFSHVMGYVKKDKMLEGIDPVDVFVVTKVLSMDVSRGCQLKT